MLLRTLLFFRQSSTCIVTLLTKLPILQVGETLHFFFGSVDDGPRPVAVLSGGLMLPAFFGVN